LSRCVARVISDVGNLSTIFDEQTSLERIPTVHEQDDGVILGVCATGTSSRDSVVSWIRFLEEENKRLGRDISVLFTLKSPIGPTDNLDIPSLQEMEAIKLVGEDTTKSREGELEIEEEEEGAMIGEGRLDVHPALPSLKQVGIWTESETVFANWPHHHHLADSQSAKNLRNNQRLAKEIEMSLQQQRMTSNSSSNRKATIQQDSDKPPDKPKKIQ
jgi:hypothetical protein